METTKLGVFVPSAEEQKTTYQDYVSRIYGILVNYEANKTINKDYVKFLCFEIQAYSQIVDNAEQLGYVTGKLITLLADGIDHQYVRKIVLDTTNFLNRIK